MTIEPTGTVATTADGTRELVVTRQFDSPIEDVWASLTETERTAKWFGPWSGEAGVGNTIEIRMGFEDGSPAVEARIDACDAPHHLGFTMSDPSGNWTLDLRLTEQAGATTLVLTQPLADPASAADMGPGWEWYLDVLLASRDDAPLPSFDDYYPAQSAYYTAQV